MSTVLFDAIKTQSRITDEVIVGFSGGKDSIVTLDLCCRYFKTVYPFFLYIVPGLSFQEQTLRWYEQHYGLDIVRLPHPDCSNFLSYGSFCVPDPDSPIVKVNDIYGYMRKQTGAYWIAAGERIGDSIVRRAMIKHSGSIDAKRGRFYPVASWSKNDVVQYIKFHKLYMGADSRRLGFSFKSLDPHELSMVKEHFPDDYEKIIAMYPFAEAGIRRLQNYGAESVSEVRNADNKPAADTERAV